MNDNFQIVRPRRRRTVRHLGDRDLGAISGPPNDNHVLVAVGGDGVVQLSPVRYQYRSNLRIQPLPQRPDVFRPHFAAPPNQGSAKLQPSPHSGRIGLGVEVLPRGQNVHGTTRF